jgi:hypothetical protein
MNSTKCQNCGLVNWKTSENCLRCATPLDHAETGMPYAAPQTYTTNDSFFDPDAAHKEKLLKDLKSNTGFFYFVGGLQILVWFFIGQLLIVDGVLNIGLAYLSRRFRSRAAAIVLLLLTLLSVLGVFYMIGSAGQRPGIMVPLVIIFRVLASARIVSATFKLRKYAIAEAQPFLPPPPPVFHQETAPGWPTAAATASNALPPSQ